MLTAAKKEFIEFMMGADVLRFGSFVTKSGRNTPYFVNTGNYRTGSQIAALGHFYASLVKETCEDRFDAMFGPAYKGIPLATACAASLSRDFGIDKPYFFNRKEVKDHGEGGSIVGYKPQDGDRIIIIEDNRCSTIRESFHNIFLDGVISSLPIFIKRFSFIIYTRPI